MAMNRLRVVSCAVLIAILATAPCIAALPERWLGQLGLGVVGGAVGATVAVVAIGEITPLLEPRVARVATVVVGLTVASGLGASAGVLAAGKLFDIEGNVRGCLLGGLLGGAASAFTEPLLYTLGIPEAVTEFLGMLFLPVLPAIGAMIGFAATGR